VSELRELARVARKYRVVLLSDEIYGELHHRGQHVSIARYYPEGTIISAGLSKWCGAGGWRLGTFAFPPALRWLQDAMAVVASETYTSTSAPIQFAAIRAFQRDASIDEYLINSRRVLRALGRRIWRELVDAGVRVTEPAGGFYLFPDFGPFAERLRDKGIHDSASLCEVMLDETGVAMLPGVAFGRPAQELTARLAYVDFDGAAALDAVARLGRGEEPNVAFLREHCGRVTTAIDRVRAWLESA
jgi:aspartate aminotransferase